MNTSHRRTLALGAAIGFALVAVIVFHLWTTDHEKDWLYVSIVFAVAALLWVGVSLKLRTHR
jgi:hypothetical protein